MTANKISDWTWQTITLTAANRESYLIFARYILSQEITSTWLGGKPLGAS